MILRLGVCNKPKVKCVGCKNSNIAPLNEEQIKKHLLGQCVLGLYPMTVNDTCYLLVMDFDESTWNEDVKTITRICNDNNIPVYIERSRSGNGCHLCRFFETEVKASIARRFGTFILNLAMQECENIKFDSYDRLFPSQDFLQNDGFGNLIALPLQKEAREHGNSVFIDKDFKEIEDQWKYLSQITKIPETFVTQFCKNQKTTEMNPEIVGLDNGSSAVYASENTIPVRLKIDTSDFPETLVLAKTNGISILKDRLSSKALYLLRRIASYNNP